MPSHLDPMLPGTAFSIGSRRSAHGLPGASQTSPPGAPVAIQDAKGAPSGRPWAYHPRRAYAGRSRWMARVALAAISLALGCGDMGDMEDLEVVHDPGPSDLGDSASDERLSPEQKAAITVSTDQARGIVSSARKSSSGLPLWESRPGARVALFLDFDGGRYDGQTYRGIDRDGNRSNFGNDEQVAMIRAALEVVEGYRGFNVNVTTSEEAMRRAPKWGWILITDDESTSGEASIGSIPRSSQCSGSSCYARGFAGSEAVFSPPSPQRGYLLIHELGHQFGLNHSGLYKNGRFYEWSELKQDLSALMPVSTSSTWKSKARFHRAFGSTFTKGHPRQRSSGPDRTKSTSRPMPWVTSPSWADSTRGP